MNTSKKLGWCAVGAASLILIAVCIGPKIKETGEEPWSPTQRDVEAALNNFDQSLGSVGGQIFGQFGDMTLSQEAPDKYTSTINLGEGLSVNALHTTAIKKDHITIKSTLDKGSAPDELKMFLDLFEGDPLTVDTKVYKSRTESLMRIGAISIKESGHELTLAGYEENQVVHDDGRMVSQGRLTGLKMMDTKGSGVYLPKSTIKTNISDKAQSWSMVSKSPILTINGMNILLDRIKYDYSLSEKDGRSIMAADLSAQLIQGGLPLMQSVLGQVNGAGLKLMFDVDGKVNSDLIAKSFSQGPAAGMQALSQIGPTNFSVELETHGADSSNVKLAGLFDYSAFAQGVEPLMGLAQGFNATLSGSLTFDMSHDPQMEAFLADSGFLTKTGAKTWALDAGLNNGMVRVGAAEVPLMQMLGGR